MKPELLILSGLPASGKTKLALGWVAEDPENRFRVNYDDLRLTLYGPDWRFNRSQENAMQEHARNLAVTALERGRSVVIDNTNLTPRTRGRWEELGKDLGAAVVHQELDTPVAECKLRDQRREGRARVGWAVIDRMALLNGFIDWKDAEVYNRQQFIVVDMDGTLADCEWRRHFIDKQAIHKMDCSRADWRTSREVKSCPECGVRLAKDWDGFFNSVEQDPPNEPILRLVKHLYFFGYDLIIASGRPMDKCGMQTERWLRKHLLAGGVLPKHLFMRQPGDKREDTVVKQEICDLLPLERIAYVLDDRASVCNQVWRRAGLTCLQVAEGKF